MVKLPLVPHRNLALRLPRYETWVLRGTQLKVRLDPLLDPDGWYFSPSDEVVMISQRTFAELRDKSLLRPPVEVAGQHEIDRRVVYWRIGQLAAQRWRERIERGHAGLRRAFRRVGAFLVSVIVPSGHGDTNGTPPA